MTYHAGTRGLAHIGIPDGDPRITCDAPGCDATWHIPLGRPPPTWFLDGKRKPGWAGGRRADGTRWDRCPAHKNWSDIR